MVFLRQVEKADLVRNLHNIKDNENWKDAYFNDDYTELQAIEQHDLRALVAYASSRGKEARVKAGAVWYEGRRYRYEELHLAQGENSFYLK